MHRLCAFLQVGFSVTPMGQAVNKTEKLEHLSMFSPSPSPLLLTSQICISFLFPLLTLPSVRFNPFSFPKVRNSETIISARGLSLSSPQKIISNRPQGLCSPSVFIHSPIVNPPIYPYICLSIHPPTICSLS